MEAFPKYAIHILFGSFVIEGTNKCVGGRLPRAGSGKIKQHLPLTKDVASIHMMLARSISIQDCDEYSLFCSLDEDLCLLFRGYTRHV